MVAFNFPTAPVLDDEYVLNGVTYKWNGYGWTILGAMAAGGAITIADDPPAGAAAGDVWWESDTGVLWLYFDDGTSQQWVQVNSGGGGSSGVGDAPVDGETYGRLNGNWAAIADVIPPAPAIPTDANNWTNLQAQPGNWLVLPAGGTWAWWAFSMNATTFGVSQPVFAGVAAGGSSVLAPSASSTHTGCCWRIA